MKKLVTLSVLAVLASASASAKTEGNFVDFSVLRSSIKLKDTEEFNKKSDSSFGFGFAYKHAISFNDFFVAPGVFFDHLGNETKESGTDGGIGFVSSFSNKGSINNRYGAKLDLGYDLNDQFSVYGTGGLSYLSYNIRSSLSWDDTTTPANPDTTSFSKKGRKSSPFVGAGFLYKINKDLALMAEYTMQNVNIKTPGSSSTNGVEFNPSISASTAKIKLNILKVGLSYHF